MGIMKYAFPIKIKNTLSNDSMLAGLYWFQIKNAPFFRLYVDGYFSMLRDMQWHGTIKAFNLLSLDVVMSEVENDIRVNDVFIRWKDKKEFIVVSQPQKHFFNIKEIKAPLKSAEKIKSNILINNFVWAPAYYAKQNDKVLSFYSSLHDLYMSDEGDLSRAQRISHIKSILGSQDRRSAYKQLNMASEKFDRLMSDYGII